MIEIVYTGSLDAFDPKKPKYQVKKGLKKWLSPYNALTTHPHTRSGYFLFKAIQRAKEMDADIVKRLHFSFYGAIDPLNQVQVKAFGIQDMVDINAFVPKKELLEIEANANAFFLPLESGSSSFKRPLFIPGKLFEYMKWQKPILCLTEESDVKSILDKAGLGICHAPENTEAISAELMAISQNPDFGRNIHPNTDYIASFAFDKIAARYAELIREV